MLVAHRRRVANKNTTSETVGGGKIESIFVYLSLQTQVDRFITPLLLTPSAGSFTLSISHMFLFRVTFINKHPKKSAVLVIRYARHLLLQEGEVKAKPRARTSGRK